MWQNTKGKMVRQSRGLMLLFCSFFALLYVFGCGGGTTGTGPLRGVFVDAPVAGLEYVTSSGVSGKTDANGVFYYDPGDTVTFKIGNLTLGSAKGASQVTPVDIVSGGTITDQRVQNMLVLLQTLDEDGDLNNGIQINAAAAAVVSANATKIKFDQTPAAFAADANITALLTALNATSGAFTDASYRTRTLRSVSQAVAHFQNATATGIVVTTKYGQLRGFEADANTWQWLGVPYAKPPVGGRRWKPPEELDPWSGIREATSWGDQAAQPSSYAAYGLGGVSEDCLNLNITAPKGAANLPVMVWFHGGGFGILTANTPAYNNITALTTKGVVLVTVNHRLGAFGYLAHPELTAESGYKGSGNYGQMDLIKALQWIKNNISAFGGNPNNVTIFGQSGGGGKALFLMASPEAKGLFHKVICQSGMAPLEGSGMSGESLAAAEAKGVDLFKRLGGTTPLTLAQARNVPWTTIINADSTAFGAQAWLRYFPNVDGKYLPKPMKDQIKELPNDVPLMAGAVSADLVAGVNLAPAITDQMPVRAQYNTADKFLYYWKYVPAGWAKSPYNVGAYHGIELVYVFNYPGSFVSHLLMGLPLKNSNPLTPLTLQDLGLSQTDPQLSQKIVQSTGYGAADAVLTQNVLTVWTNFAKNGNPSAVGIIDNWPKYTLSSDAYVEIGIDGSFKAKTGIQGAFGKY
ncbi:MAG: carboxylesterase family protein [Syntrophales bacterium]|nr:carboxylesterase family protein [Syntrophales bacterium]